MRVGVIGGGQLARMMVPPAIELGHRHPRARRGGGLVGRASPRRAVGDYTDAATVLAFARDVDVVTFDHEHVPQPVLAAARGRRARRAPRAGRAGGRAGQDRHARAARRRWALPCRTGRRVRDADEPRGVPGRPRRARRREDAARRLRRQGRAGRPRRPRCRRLVRGGRRRSGLLVEELVDFRRELAQLVARRPSGEVRALAAGRDGAARRRLRRGVRPGAGRRIARRSRPRALAERIATELDVTGVLAVELFETADGRLLVNELAMRPHNTGHWTIDGAVTSQFEQHLRAVLDLPLGDPSPTAPVERDGQRARRRRRRRRCPTATRSLWRPIRGVKFHSYGKAVASRAQGRARHGDRRRPRRHRRQGACRGGVLPGLTPARAPQRSAGAAP